MKVQLLRLIKLRREKEMVFRPNTRSNVEVAPLQTFNKNIEKIRDFVTVCKLFLRIKIRKATIEEQVQWMLTYIQEGSGDVQKKNMIKDLETGVLEIKIVGEFLEIIRKKFGEGNNESRKVAELKELKQRGITIEDFVQEFRRAVKRSGYMERLLVKEFKREMNKEIQRRLMEAECQSISIEQQYKRTVRLERNIKESK